MKRLLWATSLLLLVGMNSTTSEAEDSKPFTDRYCEGMEREHRLPDGGRVDCLSAALAIEVEWARDWYHAVGQSLYYASATGRKPGIILLCESSDVHVEGLCRSYIYRLEHALKFVEAHVDVWTCSIDTDLKLDDCFRPQIQSVSEQPLQQGADLSATDSDAVTSPWDYEWLPAVILVGVTLLASLVLFVPRGIYLSQRIPLSSQSRGRKFGEADSAYAANSLGNEQTDGPTSLPLRY